MATMLLDRSLFRISVRYTRAPSYRWLRTILFYHNSDMWLRTRRAFVFCSILAFSYFIRTCYGQVTGRLFVTLLLVSSYETGIYICLLIIKKKKKKFDGNLRNDEGHFQERNSTLNIGVANRINIIFEKY